MGNTNRDLQKARNTKDDEFYTLYETVEDEIKYYTKYIENKIIYLNTDNPENSNFWKYFYENFQSLKIKKLISTYYNPDGISYKTTYDGNSLVKEQLKGDGDFRSEECINILKESDVVITNPPFSLMREFILQVLEYNKKLLIIATENVPAYKEIFPLIKDNKLWLGVNFGTIEFKVPYDENNKTKSKYRLGEDGQEYRGLGNTIWLTNIHNKRQSDILELTKTYNKEDYPIYDNYNAIEVSRYKNIPKDYYGIMGVPITFLKYHNPEQFEILGTQRHAKSKELLNVYTGSRVPIEKDNELRLDGRELFTRVFIKRI